MRGIKLFLLLIILLISSVVFSLTQRQIGDLLEKSTVKVNNYFGNQLLTFGSGFIISSDGLIGTNYHVIQMALFKNGKIVIEFQDQKNKREAEIYNWNEFLDFAVLKIDMTGLNGLKTLKLGNSDKLKELDNIYVAGFPVTGAFKAQKGDLNSIQKLFGKSYFDISVPIDKGNSGGPIVDTDGNLIGVSVAFLTTARSMNLAIRSNDLKELIHNCINGVKKFVITDGREKEPNDTKNQANLIAQGFFIEGTLDAKDTVDWYEIAGQEGVSPAFTITHATGNNFDFEVYSDETLACKGISENPQETVQCKVPGRCFMKIFRITGSGSYSVQITPLVRVSNDEGREKEPNNTRETATLTKSMNLLGNIDGNADIDWFELEGQEGTLPSFTISHSSKVDFNFEVYSDSTLACAATGKETPKKITCSVPGRCFVKIWSMKGDGSYVIRVDRGDIIPQ